jgi:NAD(P)-dependent dehydrogenase (short-subunit alcohol dehydrogenase family)
MIMYGLAPSVQTSTAAFSLAGRVAIVTGGARGIGRSTAEIFAAAGATVAVADVDECGAQHAAAEIVRRGGAASGYCVDIADTSAVQAFCDQVVGQYGRLDTVFNAAGVWQAGSILDLTEGEWDRVMTINTRSLYTTARCAHQFLVPTRGSIISVASIAGLKGTRRAGAYNPSKAAVIALTKNLALDFAPEFIRVNCICPGLIETEMGEEVIRARGGTDAVREMMVQLHPIGRLGRPEDVAYAALYLASDQASWVTGAAFVVDGGCMAGY